ncbi:amino acid racemase [Roseateles sp. SL47]|uniref:aspartate/glutamate racemase family protein n=1 Tax=Roseateles sp. SL47 TaxID=2995138 RepID=UPI002270ADC5|nr:amino acid racemase [Roseateles sp. SL47]WAC71621.1 amino acid racemase [Roseateles sp. SL47]
MVKLTEIQNTPVLPESPSHSTSEDSQPAGPSSTPTSTVPLSPRSVAPESETGQRPRAVIGVMGGMGPAAANQFGHQLIKLKTDAKTDQEHARVLLDQATNIPDRTSAILKGTESPVPNMTASLKRLDEGGADIVAITCNTAHHFHPDMLEAIEKFGLKLDLLHIVDATMKELEAQKPGARRIGLLATSGTLDSRIYEQRSEQTGHHKDWIYPDKTTQESCVMKGIYEGVKAGRMKEGEAMLLAAAQELRNKGADAILLACTEIPLVLKTGHVKDADGGDLPLIDTLEALGKEALARAETKASRLTTPAGTFTVKPSPATNFLQGVMTALAEGEARPRRIGVMGGMGPAAAMQFSDYMVKFNDKATKDQDHVPLLLDQATDIPDRTGAILSGGRDPVPEMAASLRRLKNAGADDIVMTCNTAHYFYPQLAKIIEDEKLNLDVIHIVDATMKLLDQHAPGARNVGLLATSGTVNTGVYQNHESAKGREWLTPNADTQKDAVMAGIYDGVKAGKNDVGHQLLLKAAQELADKGADAILLACTEIPLVLKTGMIKKPDGTDLPLIDTLEAQAREAIRRSGLPIPATPGVLSDVSRLLCTDDDAPEASASKRPASGDASPTRPTTRPAYEPAH